MKKLKDVLELFLLFMKISAFTFGGGYAMISLIDHEFVEKRKWMDEDEFMDLTVAAESTPGPIAINCATYTGYKRAGFAGAAAATVGVVTPSFVIIYVISMFFTELLSIKFISSAFRGIYVAVSILVISAAVKMFRTMLKKKAPGNVPRVCIIALICIAVSLVGRFGGPKLSTVWLIIIFGAAGYIVYAVRNAGKAGRDR